MPATQAPLQIGDDLGLHEQIEPTDIPKIEEEDEE
tara:strand:+ start:416 stop:520 length:105 start_codon:yes stop_codon:yes gene_type:complete